MFNPCRIVAIILPLLGISLVGAWWLRSKSGNTVLSESTPIDISTAEVVVAKADKKDTKSFAHFNRKWHSHNVSDSTVDFYHAQGINLFYASMAATATYDFIMDINPPRAHIERKAFLKSDVLDFTFGEWTYYETPFGNFKSKMRPRGKRLIERIVDLDNQQGPIELKRYQVVSDGGTDFLKIDISWGEKTAQFYLK